MEQDSEFYIGWQATAPTSFVRAVRGIVIGLCVLVPVLAIAIVYYQKGFSNGTFEYGKMTELEGVFTAKPFPFLNVANGKDPKGNIVFQKILMVAPGKFGFVADSNQLVNGQALKVSGFLIYNDGKTALQVENISPSSAQSAPELTASSSSQASIITAPTVTLRGEITDPKCLLGVMNPGQGKPHRDCAVRCISGGLPPVLKVANADGDTEYYLLADPEGNPINDRILNLVGDGVSLCGRLEQLSDWWVLYTDPSTIKRINKATLNPGSMCN
ncbi:MAG: hypothetical protein ACKVT2_13400 [Saprospiraceae bacterium]